VGRPGVSGMVYVAIEFSTNGFHWCLTYVFDLGEIWEMLNSTCDRHHLRPGSALTVRAKTLNATSLLQHLRFQRSHELPPSSAQCLSQLLTLSRLSGEYTGSRPEISDYDCSYTTTSRASRLTLTTMASPPAPAHSPPQSHLSLPKKRPSIQLPGNPQPAKRRKPSITSATSAHPLRQTSFPPADRNGASATAIYSPGSVEDDLDVDDEISGAVGSRGSNTKAARGSKTKGRLGRPPKSVTGSVADGDSSTVVSRRGAGASTTGAGDGEGGSDEDSDSGGEEANTAVEGGKLSKAALEEEKSRRAMFLSQVPNAHFQLYELWNRIHLKKEVVRRLTNQTLSQSVPNTVVTTISAYSKVFAGEIVDRARQVQREWVAAAAELPTGDKNVMGAGEGMAKVEERDLGPLLPDHLREALRRYKMDREGGSVGFTGLSLEGRESAAARNGGKRLFK